ncbi:DUF6090 family protein [Algoriphagus taiwanensis]
MISFLRKVRMKLLGNGRFSQYLLYALGEIFLVVIGILIALQINTWNENRKQRIYELKMLKELSNTLQKDKRYLSSLVTRLDQKEKSVNRLLEIRETGFENLDTIGRYFQSLRTEILFQYNSGPYESIKAGGIDKISKDSIRTAMEDLYEFLIPRTEKILDKLEASNEQEEALMEKLTTREILVRNSTKIIQRVVSDPKIIYQDEFLHLLQLNKSNTYVSRSRIEAILPGMSKLDSMIQLELLR